MYEVHNLAVRNVWGGLDSLEAALRFIARTYPPSAVGHLAVGRELDGRYEMVMNGSLLAQRVDLARLALEHSTWALIEARGGNVVGHFDTESKALACVYLEMEGDSRWGLFRFGPTPADSELIAADRALFERAMAAHDKAPAIATEGSIAP
jgi:hypothetical protein